MTSCGRYLKAEREKKSEKKRKSVFSYSSKGNVDQSGTKCISCSVQSLDRLGRREDMRDDSADILFQSFLQEALVSSSGMARDLSSLNVVHPAFPLLTTASSTLQGAMKDGFGEAVVTCKYPNHANFPLSTVARRDSCGPTRKLILLRTQSLALCSKYEIRRTCGHWSLLLGLLLDIRSKH